MYDIAYDEITRRRGTGESFAKIREGLRKRSEDEIMELFGDAIGRAEGLKFIASIAYQDIITRTTGIGGDEDPSFVTGTAFIGESERADRQYDRLSEKTGRLKESVKVLGGEIGGVLAPGLGRATDRMTDLVTEAGEADSVLPELGAAAVIFGGQLLVAGGALKGISVGLGILKVAMASNPLGLILLGGTARDRRACGRGRRLGRVHREGPEGNRPRRPEHRKPAPGHATAVGGHRADLADENVEGQARVDLLAEQNALLEKQRDLQAQVARESEIKRLTSRIEYYADLLTTETNRNVALGLKGAATKSARERARLELGEDAPDFAVFRRSFEILDEQTRIAGAGTLSSPARRFNRSRRSTSRSGSPPTRPDRRRCHRSSTRTRRRTTMSTWS